MAVTHPNIKDATFGDSIDWPEHLLVPIGCKEEYENASYWRWFTIIEETEF